LSRREQATDRRTGVQMTIDKIQRAVLENQIILAEALRTRA
jgi:hypothetical protein